MVFNPNPALLTSLRAGPSQLLTTMFTHSLQNLVGLVSLPTAVLKDAQ